MESLRDTPSARKLATKYHFILLNQSRSLENKLISHYPGDIAKPKDDIPIKVKIT